ncbi:unnamed protein product [Calicophoron daubneyi]
MNLSLVVQEIIWIDEIESNKLLWGPSLIRSVHRFCNWALTNYYVRYNYDHALFISRNIVQAAGISPLGQMCNVQYSCTLAEDSGFFSAYPIAHEIMHSLGVEHDGEGNGCDQSGLTGNIMAPMILSASYNHYWSDCSRLVLQGAMRLQKFSCLLDYPFIRTDYRMKKPPGWRWSLDEQCQVLTGSHVSKHCPGVGEFACQELWCSLSGAADSCDRMLNHGLLDGTPCGYAKKCRDGKCVSTEQETSDLEGWSTFSPWTPCSRSQGIGTQYRERNCLGTPSGNDASTRCPGDPIEYRLCKGAEESDNSFYVDDREAQCSRYNKFKLRGSYFNWLPYVDAKRPCQLNCFSRQTGQILEGALPVRDSTQCSYENPDHRCVQSVCIPFDCRGVVNGTAIRDKCGVCEGNGSTCFSIQHNISRNLTISDGNRIVYLLPNMARELKVRKKTGTHKMSLFDMENMEFLVRGETVPFNETIRRVYLGAEFTFRDDYISTKGPIHGNLAIRAHQTDSDGNIDGLDISITYVLSVNGA